MVKFYQKFVGLLLTLAVIGPSNIYAQTVSKKLERAVNVLKSAQSAVLMENALAEIRHAAEKDNSAYAMNVLGMACMYGLGTPADTISSVKWLRAAGERGYPDAYHNMGLMYKDGIGVKQNFEKAYNSFMAGVEKGSVMCYYDAGFLLYKGLGCQQDYVQGAQLFRRGADKDHSCSLYMLGLCYRNGYGLRQDSAQAKACLERAGRLGYTMALEELQRKLPENYLHEVAANQDSLGNLPQSMPQINSMVNDTGLIAGNYEGALVMYDWSGKYLLGEKPVKMTIKNLGNGFSGQLLIDKQPVDFTADLSSDGRLIFRDGYLKLGERYLNSHAVRYRLDYARLDVWENSIAGQLGLYSLTLSEPERPMYIDLKREGSSTLGSAQGLASQNRNDRISISPNPFDHQFVAEFVLRTDVSHVEARIFNQASMLVGRISLGPMSKGSHRVTISPQVGNGEYILNIRAGEQVLRTIIIKKGGS